MIGTASALLSIIEVIGRTVGTLHYLRERWKEADFTVFNLIAQLTALRAALTKIHEWIKGVGDEMHHQLIIDLDVSTVCCRTLIDKMDAEVSSLHQVTESRLSKQSKLKLLAKKREMEELQNFVERQTNALTLLLVACNWYGQNPQALLTNLNTNTDYPQQDSVRSKCLAGEFRNSRGLQDNQR
jgi:hypothetical protein